VERIVAEYASQQINVFSSVFFTAACSLGKKPVSGGHELNGNGGGQLTLVASHPVESPATWRVVVRNNSTANVLATIKVYVICASIP
jgi:hypothetical protein